MSLDERSSGSFPLIASRIIAQSAAVLETGPSLSYIKHIQRRSEHKIKITHIIGTAEEQEDQNSTKLSDRLITPVRPTHPNVGRNAVTPQRAAGRVMEPTVSDPIENGTIPVKNSS